MRARSMVRCLGEKTRAAHIGPLLMRCGAHLPSLAHASTRRAHTQKKRPLTRPHRLPPSLFLSHQKKNNHALENRSVGRPFCGDWPRIRGLPAPGRVSHAPVQPCATADGQAVQGHDHGRGRFDGHGAHRCAALQPRRPGQRIHGQAHRGMARSGRARRSAMGRMRGRAGAHAVGHGAHRWR